MKKVAFISQPEYFRFTYEHDLDSSFKVKEFTFNYSMTEKDFEELIEYDADYNVFFRGEYIPKEVLDKIKGIKINLSSEPFPRMIDGKWGYTKDSLKRYFVFRRIRNESFDYVFHYDVSSLPLFEKDGLKISGEFVFPVALTEYAPRKRDEEWDFFFIGRSTPYREQFFEPLKHHFNFLHIAHGVWGPALVDYLSKCKICLNSHAENEISWEPRMQMVLASGCFVMSEKITPNKYLRPGIDYIEYTDKDDLFEKASYYLANPSEREKIVKNAQERIKEYFDCQKVFPRLFDDIEHNKYPKFESINNGHYFINFLGKVIK